ncbi:hypothetical protein Patl1_33446 [Pistacia atlantica]|uniref:Uncharacterized protein n=1 Tax=Pistacia atlantica TaxID=434234 RepID=A0ACC0ZQ84_9ROSI|nr:hypothetical protein Patl1_33446 [Pistacia atlantica]
MFYVETLFNPVSNSSSTSSIVASPRMTIPNCNAVLHPFETGFNFKISSGEDEYKTTMGILGNLRSYNWDAKLVLALVAFAFNFDDGTTLLQQPTSEISSTPQGIANDTRAS